MMIVQLTILGVLGGATGFAGLILEETTAIITAASLSATIGGMSGAWAGGIGISLDYIAQDEKRNQALVRDASYWLGVLTETITRTTEMNYLHLINGGSLSDQYSLADYLQFGQFLEASDSLAIADTMKRQQYGMVVSRLWQEDRVYIISYTDRPCNPDQQLKTVNGDVIEDSKLVCLEEFPGETFYVYSAPKDPIALKGETVDKHPDWYHDNYDVNRIKPVKGASLFDGDGQFQIIWENIVRSSLRNWDTRAKPV